MNTKRIFGLSCCLLWSFLFVCPLAYVLDHSTFIADSFRQCSTCHPRALPTHLLSAAMTKSADWPVGSDGRIVCLTCHDCSKGFCILRRTSQEICRACHDCTTGMGCVLGTAHMGDASQFTGHAQDCLSCHDGTVAVNRSAGPGEHPVERVYIAGTKFNPLSGSAILLVSGRITCISCHNPYKNEEERLNRAGQGSSFCISCHRK